MTQLTDPAREYAELCEALAQTSDLAGDKYLANKFDVPPWSAEFYQIVFCILERADRLSDLVSKIDLDDDFRAEAMTHIAMTKNAFNRGSLTNVWHAGGHGAALLSPANVQPIKMLSPQVRGLVSYPKLSEAENLSLRDAVTEFQGWLEEHQLSENDFVRQALIDGLAQFSFRLTKVKWLGWGYTIQSLKDVIAAYKLLEGAAPTDSSAPDAEAALKKGLKFFGPRFQRNRGREGRC